jgi:RES domain-containing protein
MLDGLAIIRDAFPRTVRLVSTARLRAPVLLNLVEPDELSTLAEIEGATSGRLIAQERGLGRMQPFELVYNVPHANFINASFAYAKPREPNRFNGPERGAWYASLEVETSMAEVAFHMTAALSKTDAYNAVVDYAEMFASFAGEFLDLREAGEHPCLDPDPAIGYPAGNLIAHRAIARGLNGVIYPSVRRANGTCLAALWPHAVQSVAQGDIYRMVWRGSPEPEIIKLELF